ncbi:hypothetical protein A2U01_0013981, partial [Trifolium medium]|nr:hypothetical protein [Trifolium medium]
ESSQDAPNKGQKSPGDLANQRANAYHQGACHVEILLTKVKKLQEWVKPSRRQSIKGTLFKIQVWGNLGQGFD